MDGTGTQKAPAPWESAPVHLGALSRVPGPWPCLWYCDCCAFPAAHKSDDTPLISVVKEQALGFTTEIPIYHADGTYLAKVRGTRVYATEDGKKAGVVVKQLPNLWVCSVDGRTAFEIHQQPGDAFRTQA